MRVGISTKPLAALDLFLLRVLFHGCLLVLYPLILVYLVIGFKPNTSQWSIWGTALAGLVATTIILSLLLLDYMTLKRRPSPNLAILADFLLTGALIPTMWILPYIPNMVVNDDWLKSTSARPGWNPFFQLIRFGIPSFCFLYMLFLVIIPLRRPGAIDTFFAIPPISSDPPSYDTAPIYKIIYGPLRCDTERERLERNCSSIIFRQTIARKHPFEPAALGIIRGLFAVYALLGLITYGMAILADVRKVSRQQAGGQTVERSVVPLYGAGDNNLRIISARAEAHDADNYELINLSVTFNNNGLNFVNSSTGMRQDPNNHTRTDFVYSFDNSQPDISTYDAYPVTTWCRNTTLLLPHGDSELSAVDCHISSNGGSIISSQLFFPSPVRRYMWVFDTSSEDISDPPATNLSAPYILPVGANLDVYMSPEQKIIGDTNWLRYNFDTIVPTTFTNMPTVTLTPFYSNWTTSDVMTPTDPPSIFTALLSVIGKLGGVFVTLNGIFVIVFGRTVWAVVAGGRPITPFGIFSNFAWYRASIHQHYPRLQSDCESNGMAGFLEEVAMDVGIIEHKDNHWSDPRRMAGGAPRWSGEAHDQAAFIEMRTPSPNVTDRHFYPGVDK